MIPANEQVMAHHSAAIVSLLTGFTPERLQEVADAIQDLKTEAEETYFINPERASAMYALVGRGDQDNPISRKATEVANAFNELRNLLDDAVPPPDRLEEIDWQDTEAELTIKNFIFWWTWGN